MPKQEKLHPDFDLYYDIKTLEQLKDEYRMAVEKVKMLEELAEHHKVPLED